MSDSEAPARSAPPVLLLGSHGLLAGWHGPLGHVVARFDRYSQRAPRWAIGLGHPGADLPSQPAILLDGADCRVAWCEEDGAWVARLDLDEGELADAALVVPGAQRIAFGGRVLFAADGLGIVAARVDAWEPLVRVVSERRAGFSIAAGRLRDGALLAFTHPRDRAWGVASVPPAGDPIVVKHALGARCESVRVRAVRSRAAVMLGLDGDRARLALVGEGAKIIERPHEVFELGAGPLRWPEVVWTDDRWTALAQGARDDRLLVQPVGDKGVRFDLPRCDGPFAAAYFHKRFYALEVEPRGEHSELRLWRVEPDGSEQQQRVIEGRADDHQTRRVARDVRFALRGVAHRIETSADYRTQAPRPALSRDGGTLRLEDERGVLTLRARPLARGGLSLRVSSALSGGDSLGEAPTSLVRMARWIRERWSAEARRANAARERWAAALADVLGARVDAVDVAGDTLVLRLIVGGLPDPEILERWLRRLREEQASFDQSVTSTSNTP